MSVQDEERDLWAASFADYVIDGLKRTNITQAELSRASGLSPQIISRIVRKQAIPPANRPLYPRRRSVLAIARAFNDPPAVALAAAGYAIEQTEYPQNIFLAVQLLADLTDQEQENILEVIKVLREQALLRQGQMGELMPLAQTPKP